MPLAKPVRPANPIRELLTFPLISAIFGRRARRFAMGMEIPSGPLAFKSRHAPVPLSELEQAILVAAATGVTGWNFGIPHTPSRPSELAHYLVRSGGRTAPPPPGLAHRRSFTPMTTGFTSPTCATPNPHSRKSSKERRMTSSGYWPPADTYGKTRRSAAGPAAEATLYDGAQPLGCKRSRFHSLYPRG